MFTSKPAVCRLQAAAAAAINPAHHHPLLLCSQLGPGWLSTSSQMTLTHARRTHIVRSHCNPFSRKKNEIGKKFVPLGGSSCSSWVASCCRGQINHPRSTSGSGGGDDRQDGGGRYLWSGAGLLIEQGVHLPH